MLLKKQRGAKPKTEFQSDGKLYSEIGRLKMELDWLKKVRDQPAMTRHSWPDPSDKVPLVRQCLLAGVYRATIKMRVTRQSR
ncbi:MULTISPECIES: hypothetical protein [Halomonas]|uniref:Uncharacterized protein n=1 Tax=Halomonas ventosae TaxID=229007 RepID=A0A4R6HNQ5_9GAMM|nr:hypothetical protein [Halomonas ventosae]TDO09928.1 hypothetical protein DFO68_106185 [Halomonas ventosae]